MDLIGILHERSPLFLTREQFERSLDGWAIEPVEHEGRVIGCFVIQGAKLHFAKLDATPVTRAHLRRLQQLIDTYGYAETATPKEDARQLKFNKKLGFFAVGEDEYDYTMRIERFR